MNKYKIITAVICAISGVTNVHAQNTITFESAIELAIKNNLSIKNSKLNAEYQKKLEAAAVDIPFAIINTEYGNINSIYKDTRFGISQAASFPTVYAKQKLLQNEMYKSSLISILIKEAEVKKQVSQVFYLIIYLNEKKKLLLYSDSIYSQFVSRTNLKFKVGDSNILEKTTAETQQGQIANQLKQISQDIDILVLQLQMLLNSDNSFMPAANDLKMKFDASIDTSILLQHPVLKALEQENKYSIANTRLEKSKLLPNISLAYNNMSIQGIGADNVLYPKSSRFASVQFGVGVPLFFGAQKARINSAKSMEQIADNNYKLGLQKLKTDYSSALIAYNNKLQLIDYFENTALKQAKLLQNTCNQQFTNGYINYLDWVMLINNSIAIQSNYVDAVNELNQTIININYLTSNNK